MDDQTLTYQPTLEGVKKASEVLKEFSNTPLLLNHNLSDEFEANIWLKREDLQIVRSYKIRGAYNLISSLSKEQAIKGVVTASAGNHAQGVAYACNKLGIKGTIFMPATTPDQKVKQVRSFGKHLIDVVLTGDTFDDAKKAANHFCTSNDAVFVHPFDDPRIIEGQGTVALEILEQVKAPIDYLFIPVGGGGLSAGMITVFKSLSPGTIIIGVEPEGAPAMKTSIKKGENTTLETIDTFIDGASVKRVGELNFKVCNRNFQEVITVNEGHVCNTILKLYNRDAIVVEPAGAMSITALEEYKDRIRGKNVVCVLSGSNNDIIRTEEIKERALLYNGLKHYFVVRFPQRSGALKEFVAEILGPEDDITYFQYSKKHNREKGPAVVGVQLKHPKDLEPLIERMKEHNFFGEHINLNPDLLNLLT